MNTRPLFTATLLLTTFGTASAQRSGLGIKGGLMAATTTAQHIETSIVPGATAGLYAPFQVGNRLEVQPELLISILGSGFIEPNGDRTNLHTLMVQVPLSLKLYFSNVVNAQAGVQFGKVLSAQRIDPEGSTNVTSDMRPVDMGVNIGLGFDTQNGVDLALRYYSGLWTIYQNDDALFPRNRTLQLTAGFRIARFSGSGMTRRRR
ncbi:MAG: PorT family protein [Flavobacteriales bacterium]|nr:PorT family protein [Flavobacteriales bacterium]